MRSKTAQRILSETPEETKIFARLYADIIVRVHQLLKEKGFSQKDLADKLQKWPSEVNKWLKGEHNFTLRSLAKLQAELGEEIINVPFRQQVTSAVAEKGKFYLTVYKNSHINTNDVQYKNVWKKQKTKNKTMLVNVS